MKICLVRHAETDNNISGIMQGQSINSQLNKIGVMNANNLKNKIKNINFTACYTSSLIRCWSTAMILVGDRVQIKEDKRLNERYLGNLEGKKREMYDYKLYWDYSLNSNKDDVEKIQDIFKRCNDFLNYIKNTYDKDDVILVVSHSAVIRCLHHLILETDLNSDLTNFNINNCYFREYEIK